MLTAERLKQVLSYNPATGVFTWRTGKRAGKVAGSIDRNGRRRICIDGRHHLAHCLAFLYMTGEWSAKQINHADDDIDNNRWTNLRQATSLQSHWNRRTRNHLGVKGVQLKRSGNYQATIVLHRRKRYLGTFTTLEEASQAYADAARLHFGEFARAA